MTWMPKYNHVKEEFDQIVRNAIPKLDILNYYPYGKEKHLTMFVYENYDLTKAYLEKHNQNKSELYIAFEIVSEIARAMRYLMTHGNDDGWDHQRIKAFALCKLFESGISDWTKEPIQGLKQKEKIKLYYYHLARYNKLSSYKNKRYLSKAELRKLDMQNLERLGVLEVKHYPLTQHLNTCFNCKPVKLFYTKQQLCAIKHYVDCSFENLC